MSLDPAHGDGWFLLRLSLHDPLMPLNIESDSAGGAKKIAAALAGFLAGFEKLGFRQPCSVCGMREVEGCGKQEVVFSSYNISPKWC